MSIINQSQQDNNERNPKSRLPILILITKIEFKTSAIQKN